MTTDIKFHQSTIGGQPIHSSRTDERLCDLERRVGDLERGLTDLMRQVDVLANRGAPARVVSAAAVEPAAVEPAAVEPAAVEPAAVEPAAVEPAAVEPVAVDPVAVASLACSDARSLDDWSSALPAGDATAPRDVVLDAVGQASVEVMHIQAAEPGPADSLMLAGLARQTARLAALMGALERAIGQEQDRTAGDFGALSAAVDRLAQRLDDRDRARTEVTASVSALTDLLIGSDGISGTQLPAGGIFGAVVERLDRIAADRGH